MSNILGLTPSVTLEVRVEGMVSESPDAKEHLYREMNDAMAFVEGLGTSGGNIVGSWTGGYNQQERNRNWYYAVGGYNAAGSGKWKQLRNCKYEMTFTFNFDDRYNWDAGKSVTINGKEIQDTALGRLHQVGLAQEYDMHGKATRSVTWVRGDRFDVTTGQLPSHPGR